MPDREIVHEIQGSADLTLEVPLALGSAVGTGAADMLAADDTVRHVQELTVHTVEKESIGLRVAGNVDLTLHVPTPFAGNPAERLERPPRNHDSVLEVGAVDVVEDYPIESY